MKGKIIKALILWVLPWCGLLALLSYEVYVAKRQSNLVKQYRKGLPTAIDEMIDDADVLAADETMTIVRFWGALGDTVCLVVNGRAGLLITANEVDVPASVTVNVYADGFFEKELLQCGTRGAKSEWYLVMHPQTGPDAGKGFYGDYDLDGTFEHRPTSRSGTRIE